MDPDETLRRLRHWAACMLNESDQSESEDPEQTEAAELFTALDGWISSAGFLPRDWE